MREHASDFLVSETLLTHEEPENANAIVRRLIRDEPNIRGIFVNGGGILSASFDIRIVCRDIGPETRRGLSEGLVTAALRHPVDETPKALIEIMLRLVEQRGTNSIEQRIVPFEIVTPESL